MKKFLIVNIAIFLLACSSGGDGDGGSAEVKDPIAALLVFPDNNSECTEGTNKTTTKSTIKFEWNAAQNADSYSLVVKNLNSNTESKYVAQQPFKEVSLNRGEAYSWYVVSISNSSKTTAQSQVWKFYNAGEDISSYAPFPADIISPINNETITETSITLVWSATDLDGDIKNFDVYLGLENPPSLLEGNIVQNSKSDVIVESGKTYYWKVVTKDELGNVSTSEINTFQVE